MSGLRYFNYRLLTCLHIEKEYEIEEQISVLIYLAWINFISFISRLRYLVSLLTCVHIEKEYERSYHKVIEEQLSVLIYLARINFVGLPRSGKSSTLRRLIGKMLNLMKANLEAEIPSTGVGERNQAFIRKISKCFGFISRSQWSSTDLAGETGVLNQFLHQLAKGE